MAKGCVVSCSGILIRLALFQLLAFCTSNDIFYHESPLERFFLSLLEFHSGKSRSLKMSVKWPADSCSISKSKESDDRRWDNFTDIFEENNPLKYGSTQHLISAFW